MAFLATLALPAPATPVQAQSLTAPGQRVVTYIVKKGETLSALSVRYFLTPNSWRSIWRDNHIADPHTVPTGTMLRIPLAMLRVEPLQAKVAAAQGDVVIAHDNGSRPATAGADVPSGAHIETGAEGFATILLSSGTRITLPTRTRIWIRAMGRVLLTDEPIYDIRVEARKAEFDVAPLPAGKGRFEVSTPKATTAVRGTHLRVGFGEATGISQTEVTEGKVAVTPEGQSDEAPVPAGSGAIVAGDGRLAVETLLDAPTLKDPGRVQVDPQVLFTVEPLDKARAYHLQIAGDAGFTDLTAETIVTTPEASFDLPKGRWFVRVSAIAASGLEGLARTYSFRRVPAGLGGAASQDKDSLRFKWFGEGDGQRVYHFQLFRSGAPEPLIDEPGLTSTEVSLGAPPPGDYRWRVGVAQVSDGEVVENWLPFETLTVSPPGR